MAAKKKTVTLESVDAKVDALDAKTEDLDTKVDALDTKVEILDIKVDALDKKFHSLEIQVYQNTVAIEHLRKEIQQSKNEILTVLDAFMKKMENIETEGIANRGGLQIHEAIIEQNTADIVTINNHLSLT